MAVGDAYDNAMAESFFSTLECELLARRRFAHQTEARMAIFSYIEAWYNPVRLHSALGYRSPMTFEKESTPKTRQHCVIPKPPDCPPIRGNPFLILAFAAIAQITVHERSPPTHFCRESRLLSWDPARPTPLFFKAHPSIQAPPTHLAIKWSEFAFEMTCQYVC